LSPNICNERAGSIEMIDYGVEKSPFSGLQFLITVIANLSIANYQANLFL